jgi:hypothetical protein
VDFVDPDTSLTTASEPANVKVAENKTNRTAEEAILGKFSLNKHEKISGLWIRIRIGSGFNDFVDPDSESGSKGKKNEEKNAFFLTGNFLNIFIAKR